MTRDVGASGRRGVGASFGHGTQRDRWDRRGIGGFDGFTRFARPFGPYESVECGDARDGSTKRAWEHDLSAFVRARAPRDQFGRAPRAHPLKTARRLNARFVARIVFAERRETDPAIFPDVFPGTDPDVDDRTIVDPGR